MIPELRRLRQENCHKFEVNWAKKKKKVSDIENLFCLTCKVHCLMPGGSAGLARSERSKLPEKKKTAGLVITVIEQKNSHGCLDAEDSG